MENYYKKQMTLLQQTKVVGTGVKRANIIPPGVQNQQSILTSPVNIAEIQNPVQSVTPSNTASTTYQNLNPGIVLTQMPQKVTQYNEIENQITKNPDLGKTTQPGHVSTFESNEDGTRTGGHVSTLESNEDGTRTGGHVSTSESNQDGARIGANDI